MDKILLDVLSNVSNCPVLQLPQRRHPGVLIQGDSLANIYLQISELAYIIRHSTTDEEVNELAQGVVQKLEGYLLVYQDALQANGLDTSFITQVVSSARHFQK